MSENSTNARAEEKARTNELPHHIANLLYTSQALPAQVLERSELRIAYVPGIMPGKWFTRWHERYGDRAPLAEIPVGEGLGIQALTTELPPPKVQNRLHIWRLCAPTTNRAAETQTSTTASDCTKKYPC